VWHRRDLTLAVIAGDDARIYFWRIGPYQQIWAAWGTALRQRQRELQIGRGANGSVQVAIALSWRNPCNAVVLVMSSIPLLGL
jgi:hypothetical protein